MLPRALRESAQLGDPGGPRPDGLVQLASAWLRLPEVSSGEPMSPSSARSAPPPRPGYVAPMIFCPACLGAAEKRWRAATVWSLGMRRSCRRRSSSRRSSNRRPCRRRSSRRRSSSRRSWASRETSDWSRQVRPKSTRIWPRATKFGHVWSKLARVGQNWDRNWRPKGPRACLAALCRRGRPDRRLLHHRGEGRVLGRDDGGHGVEAHPRRRRVVGGGASRRQRVWGADERGRRAGRVWPGGLGRKAGWWLLVPFVCVCVSASLCVCVSVCMAALVAGALDAALAGAPPDYLALARAQRWRPPPGWWDGGTPARGPKPGQFHLRGPRSAVTVRAHSAGAGPTGPKRRVLPSPRPTEPTLTSGGGADPPPVYSAARPHCEERALHRASTCPTPPAWRSLTGCQKNPFLSQQVHLYAPGGESFCHPRSLKCGPLRP